jgi:NAD dependent epimerase/dehydratase
MSNYWNGKPVLVTGAGGFIGSHLVESLALKGARVRAFVRYNSRGEIGMLRYLPQPLLEKVEITGGDLRDSQAVRNAVKGNEFVFHLGALISIPYSYHHPQEVAETNLIGTLNILLACQEHRVGRLIHTSTSEVYGTAVRVPIDEAHPLQAQSPYSASKIGADKLVESFHCTYELPVVTVRPFNTFGPRQSARAVIPTIITQALFKDSIQLGALDTVRDFTYVTDTVNGFLKAAVAQEVEGLAINLGSGHEIRIGELAQLIIQLVGKTSALTTDTQRLRPEKSEVMRLLSDNSLARQRLGWRVEVPLEQGLRETIAWIQEHHQQYRIGVYEF